MNLIKSIFAVVCLLPSQIFAANEKTNFVVILVDDLGYADLSCQGYAHDIQTPNIDKLLNEGVRFTNFYANSTVSSPSRAALLTGKYPDLVGVPGVIRADSSNSWGYLSESVELLPQLLKKKNYNTALIGKWHLGIEYPNLPRARGFDYFKGFLSDMMDDYYTHLRHGVNYMFENEKMIYPKGHATDLFTDWAVDYVTKQTSKKDPFFLYLAYNAPHYPEQPPIEWLERVQKREHSMSLQRAKLVALIEHLDQNIGRLYHALKVNGQLENTMILFASDNGGNLPSGANNQPYRGGKQDMFEGGIHVAGGVYMKDKISPAVNHNMVMLFDFFPTICEFANIKPKHSLDAISIAPILRGKNQITDNRVFIWMRREGREGYWGQDYYACRLGDFKLLQNNPFQTMQLFNLQNDSSESYPLITENNAENYKLRKIMSDHLLKTGAVPWQKIIK